MLIDSAALNRLSVLQSIRRRGPISRVELADLLGLSKGLVTEIVAELIDSGMVGEEVSPLRERGRPRVLLEIRAHSFAVVSANVGMLGVLDLTLVDLSGNLLESRSVPQRDWATAGDLVHWIADAVEGFMASPPLKHPKIACVAVAIPGIIESSTGVLHWFSTLPEKEFPAADVMSERLGLPVIIENNLDSLARAEHWFGDDAAANDFTIVYQGLSVGLAQYADGIPRTGIAGVNSEFGHVKTDFSEQARTCFCGAQGCLTAYSSSLGIVASRIPYDGGLFPSVDIVVSDAEILLQAAVAGEAGAVSAFATAGRHLGRALANYINILDPRLVLVRVADGRMAALIEHELRAALAEYTIPTLLQRTNIVVGAALADWQRKGTAALALEQAYLGKAVRKGRDFSKAAIGSAAD